MSANTKAMAVGLSLFFCLAASAQEPNAKPRATVGRAEIQKIKKHIANLDSEDFSIREAALKALLEAGPAAVAPLKAALKKAPRSPEFIARARRVLALHDGGGAAVNGLKVTLAADKASVQPGETVTFTTTLSNLTDHPLNVQVGYSTCGNYFECGSAFRRLEMSGEGAAKKLAAHPPKWQVGFCGTGAGPIFVTLPAKGSASYRSETLYALSPVQRGKGGRGVQGKSPAFTFGKNRYCYLSAPKGGTPRLRVSLKVAKSPVRFRGWGVKGGGKRPTDAKAPYWHGEVHSNDVKIEIVKK